MSDLVLHGGPLHGRTVPRREVWGGDYRAMMSRVEGEIHNIDDEVVLTRHFVVYQMKRRFTEEFRHAHQMTHADTGFEPDHPVTQAAWHRYMALMGSGRDAEEWLEYVGVEGE